MKIKELEAALASNPCDTQSAIKIIDENPAILLEKLQDYDIEDNGDLSYSLHDMASLISYYFCDDVFQHVLKNYPKQLQNSLFFNSLLKNKDEEMMDYFLNSHNLKDFELDKCVTGNSFVTNAIKYNWSKEYIQKFINAGSDVTLTNAYGENAFTACAEKGDINIYNIINHNMDILNVDVDAVLNASIRGNNSPVFDEVLQYTQKPLDYFFSQAVFQKQTQIVSTIIFEESFMPGGDQINDLIKLITYNYADEEDAKAAVTIMDFLTTVKIPFNKFIDKEGNNIWNLALDNHNTTLINLLLSLPNMLNLQDLKGRTPLMYAINKRNHKQIDALLAFKPKLNIEDFYGDTAIIACARQNLVGYVPKLIEAGANVYHRNGKDETALYWACHYKDFEAVAKLLWAGAPIADNTKELTTKSLGAIVDLQGNVETFQNNSQKTLNNFSTLVDLGFNINILNEDGDTLPMHFLKNNQINNFQSICECQFNPNQVSSSDGSTLLIEAVKKTNSRYVELLFSKFPRGINAGNKDNNNMDAIDYAIGYRNHLGLWKILTEAYNVDQTKVVDALPIILGSKEYSMREMLKLANYYNVPLQDILTEKNEDMWIIALKRGNQDDLNFLFENFEEGPNFNLKDSNNYSFMDILKNSDIDIVTRFKDLLSKKKLKI